MVLRYGNAIEQARAAHPGVTVRYEELTADPRDATQRLCAFLGVAWEPAMLDYGRFDHGRMKPGLGDWKAKIKSGEVQQAEPPPPRRGDPPVAARALRRLGLRARARGAAGVLSR